MSDLNINISSYGLVGVEQKNAMPDTTENQKEATINSSKVTLPNSSAAQVEEVTTEKMNQVIEEMNHSFQSMQRKISFSVDERLGDKVIVVKDTETDEVVRQIPSEELVVLRKKMDDVYGILFDTKV